MDHLPWEINPDLERERLMEVANLLTEVRGEVIERHDVGLGDTRLSLGMRAYECCRSRIIAEAEISTWPWLSVLTPTGRFTFTIGKTPVRFVRNDPTQLPSEKLVPSAETQIQMQMFDDDDSFADLRWFYVIDTYYKNIADNMYFVGYSKHGEIVCQWDIPLEDKSVVLVSVSDNDDEAPVEISKAPVKLKLVSNKDAEDDKSQKESEDNE